MFDGMNDVFLY